MVEEHNTLRAIDFDKKNLSLRILDQLVIPYSTTYIDIRSIEDAFQAIKRMQVRGAPAIAIVGSFAIVVEINFILLNHKTVTVEQLLTQIDYLVTSRPTAVNLGNSARDIKDLVLRQNKKEEKLDHEILELVLDYSLRLYEDDLINNFKIGENGLKYIKDELKRQNFEGPFSILTVCNTGSLATSGHGTALGVIRTTYSDLKRNSNEPFWLEKVYPCETRPYNQGSRLTTYELDYEKIPFTLVCDNMVVSLINSLNQQLTVKDSNAPIKFIIVGADRVVKNGDTANKIGTFQLAAIANFFNQNSDEKHKINFLVALPTTSLDMVTTSGEKIVVEERPSRELTTITGQQLKNDGTVGDKAVIGIATPGISVWNPAFDITPHSLIDSIITEDEVYTKKEGRFNF